MKIKPQINPDTLVRQHHEFLGHCPLLVWNGGYDYATDTA